MKLRAGILLTALSCLAVPASADTIFKCVGKDGTVDYRNFPCPTESETKVLVRTDAEEASPPASTRASEPPQSEPEAPPPPNPPYSGETDASEATPHARLRDRD
jgi:Domain of unknown function (DUF4124)